MTWYEIKLTYDDKRYPAGVRRHLIVLDSARHWRMNYCHRVRAYKWRGEASRTRGLHIAGSNDKRSRGYLLDC